MTRTYNDRRNEITAIGGQTDFTYDWRLDNQADVVVTHKVNSTGAVSTLTITTEYTVAGVGVAGGGTITLVTGAAVNDLIILEDNRQPERTQDYSTSGDLLADSLDGDQDRRVDIMMNHERQLDRSLHLAPIELNAVSMEIPVAVAGEAWRWDAAGTAIEHFTPQGDPADDVGMCFGTDADFCIVYDSAADALEIRNEAGTPLITITDTSNTFAQNSTFSGTLTVTGLMQSTTAGIGIAHTDGTLHVHTASCGAQSAPAAADDLVVENNASGGMTILTPDAASSEIVFGSPSRQTGAFIDWRFGNLAWQIGTATASAKVEIFSGNGVLAMTLNSTQDVEIPSGILTVNSDTDGTTILGRAKIGSVSTDQAVFAHFGHFTTGNYALLQTSVGLTRLNARSAQPLQLAINNVSQVEVDGTDVTIATNNLIVTAGTITASSDVDGTHVLGRAKIFSVSADNVSFSHFDHATTTGFGFQQLALGDSIVNANTGRQVRLSINNVTMARLTTTTFSLESSVSMVVAGDLQVNGGDITSTSGAIAFGNENLSTTGTLASGALTVTGNAIVSGDLQVNGGDITSTTGAIAFGNENLSTTGTLASGALTVTGAAVVTDTLTVNSDTDGTTILGRAKISSPVPDIAYFSHFDRANSTDYAVRQNTDGFTRINSAVGQVLDFLIGNAQELILSNTDLTLPTNDFTVTEGDVDITAGGLTVGTTITAAGNITIKQGIDTTSATDIALFFGSTNQEQLRWDGSDQGFLFSDDLRITGGLTVAGAVSGVTTLAASGQVTVGTPASTRGILSLNQGSGGNQASYITLISRNGTARTLWIEDDGTLKVHTIAPVDNADGDVVGAQT